MLKFKEFKKIYPNIQFIPDCVNNPLSPRFSIDCKYLIHDFYNKTYKHTNFCKSNNYYQLYDVIEYFTFKKFMFNCELLHILKYTDDKHLVFLSNNNLLGIGYTDFNDVIKYQENWGANFFGRSLMMVRSKILNKKFHVPRAVYTSLHESL
jgi:hypothetical protein